VWFIIGLMGTVNLFCRLAYGEENNFIQPCPDAGGYRSWLGGPNKNHLGHDYNAPAGTKVRAIADGTVWYVGFDISGFGSEGKPGPAIWIRHRLVNGKYFYALYGHIKPSSDVQKGAEIKSGQIIGTVIEYRDKTTKEDISHLHLGIWNSESDPPPSKMGYGPTRHFTDPLKFLKDNKPYVKEEPQRPVESASVALKWTREDIGKPRIFSEVPYYFVIYSGVSAGPFLLHGPKISKDGILYVDVVGPEGPKLHAIDINSGKILKSKEIQPGYELCGISQKVIYLVVLGQFEPKSLLAIDRANWNPLWEKTSTELDEKFGSMLLIENGILYRRTFLAGQKRVPVDPDYPERGYRDIPQYKTEIGLLSEVTGKPEPLWEPPKDREDSYVAHAKGIVSSSNFKYLSIEKHIKLRKSAKARYVRETYETYTSSVLDLSNGQVLSTKDWSTMPDILGQCEADSTFFINAEGPCIISIDMNTGDVKWETEKLITSPWFVGATKKVLLVYGSIEQRGTPYTLWYGIDATNGKILWKKWAKVDYEKGVAPPFFMGDEGWTEMINEVLLIGKGNQLALIDALTGEIMTQQEEFPIAMWYGGHVFYKAVYKDILIIGTPNGLRAYQIKR